MMRDNLFSFALFLSVGIHTAFFVGSYVLPSKPMELRLKPTEIVYQVVQKEQPKKSAAVPQVAPQQFTDHVKLVEQKQNLPVQLVKDKKETIETIKIHERPLEKMKNLSVAKKVTVPELQSGKINNPAYLTYYQMVRSRIKERAYENYSQMDEGEIYLTFILNSNGIIRDIKIIEQKTFANEYLRKVGLKSIKDASPFPAFPKELQFPELTFNVIISFQVDQQN